MSMCSLIHNGEKLPTYHRLHSLTPQAQQQGNCLCL